MPTSRASRRSDDSDGQVVRRPRRWPWVVVLVVFGLIILAVAGGILLAAQALSVRSDLSDAKEQLSSLTADVRAGDSAAVTRDTKSLQKLTAHADATVSNPLWAVASVVPVVGPNVDAVRQAAQATNIVVRDAAPAGVKIMDTLRIDKISVKGGGVDLAPVEKAGKLLPTVTTAFTQAKAKLDRVDRKKLLPVVDDAVGSLFDVIDQTTPTLQTVQKYVPTILDAAGANGKRSYLVIFQNLAESRASGGLPAAGAVIATDKGKMSLEAQTGTYSYPRGQNVIDIPATTTSLYEPDTFRIFSNFTRTPDFPTTAKLFNALWKSTNGTTVDGVFSIDPVVLSHILAVTGPVKTPDGRELNSSNVVNQLLYDAYQRYPVSQQDGFFAAVAANVFEKMFDGGWDPVKMYNALAQSAHEQRLHLWFTRPAAEKMAQAAGLDGAMATKASAATEVGIFLNDAAYSKLEYFLSTSVSVQCDVPKRTITTTMTIKNDVPASGMSNYQLGFRNKNYGIPRTTFILDALSFASPGGKLTSLTSPAIGDASATRTGTEAGRQGKSIRLFVPRGTSTTVTSVTTLPKGDRGPLVVRQSPTVTETPVTIAPSCGELTGD